MDRTTGARRIFQWVEVIGGVHFFLKKLTTFLVVALKI